MTTDDGIICPDCGEDLLEPADTLNLVRCPTCRRCYKLPAINTKTERGAFSR